MRLDTEVWQQITLGFVVTAVVGCWRYVNHHITKINSMTEDLHRCHLGPNAVDADGAFKWYGRQELHESMIALSTAISTLASILAEMRHDQKEARSDGKEQLILLRKLLNRLPYGGDKS